MLRSLKVLFVLFTIVVITVATYAFADANTVPDTKAGDGSGTVSGYTVTGVVYNLNTTNPATLDTGTVWECDTTGLTVATINQLRVVAASN